MPAIAIGDHLYLIIGILRGVARQPDLLGSVIIPEGTARHDFGLGRHGAVVVETRTGGRRRHWVDVGAYPAVRAARLEPVEAVWTVGPEHKWPPVAGPTFTTLAGPANAPSLRVRTSLTMLSQPLMAVVQMAQSLAEVEATLAQLRLALLVSVRLLVADVFRPRTSYIAIAKPRAA